MKTVLPASHRYDLPGSWPETQTNPGENAPRPPATGPAQPFVTERADAVARYIERVKHLPPAPTVATQLLGLFSEADRDVDRIVELIGLDPSLTAEVLKRTNSAFMGLASPVRDMFEAVFQLGFYEVYCIVISLVGARSMSTLQPKGGWKTEALWQHCVTTASAAATLAKRIKATEAMAFTAGLLHDIGKLLLASVERTVYANLIQDAGAFGPALVTVEEASFGFNHAELGASLLQGWQLPEDICSAVRHHHSCSSADPSLHPLPALVSLANDIAHQLFAVAETRPPISTAGTEALAHLGLTVADLPQLVDAAQNDLHRVEALLQFRP